MGAEKEYIIMAQWQCEEIKVLSLFECSQQFLLELRHHSNVTFVTATLTITCQAAYSLMFAMALTDTSTSNISCPAPNQTCEIAALSHFSSESRIKIYHFII